MRVGIIVFPGSNGDHDALYALGEVLGQQAEVVWHTRTDLERYDMVVLPGGFSYGDYLRAGAIARFTPAMDALKRYAEAGGWVLGICNGFQVLTEAHLLPGALMRNGELSFSCRWVHVRVEESRATLLGGVSPGTVWRLPIAHGEGRYFAQPDILDEIERNGQVVLRYCLSDGSLEAAANPNGSSNGIAGICNREGNVLGLMPHPERAAEAILGGTTVGSSYGPLSTHGNSTRQDCGRAWLPASSGTPDDSTTDPVERERALMDRDLLPDGKDDVALAAEGGYGGRWTLLSKLAVALSIGLIAGYLLLWARTVQERGGPENYVRITDFISVLTGATIIRDGNGPLLYDLETQQDAQFRVRGPLAAEGDRLLPYNHVPFEALATAPFMDLPFPLIFAIWTMLAGLSIGMSLGMMDGVLPSARPLGWVMSMAACSYLPLMRGLMLGQNSPFVLLGLCALYVALKRNEPLWAGVALLLIALKPQVLPLVLLVLLIQRQWKALAVFGGLMTVLSLLAMTILGPGWPLQYINLLIGVAGWSDTAAIDPAIMHNWRGFATNLFGSDSSLVTPLYLLLTLACIAMVAWSVWRAGTAGGWVQRQTEGYARPEKGDLIWALVGIVAVLISPHLNPHDLTLLIFPAWILGTYAASGVGGRTLSRVWVAILWAGYAVLPVAYAVQSLQRTGDNTAIIVVPSVLLMAGAAALLVWQIGFAVSDRPSMMRSQVAQAEL